MNQERLQKLQEYLGNDPSDPFLVYAIAQEYDRGGEETEAENWYRRLLKDHPAYVATYYHFGKLLERTGKSTEAVQMYEIGIEVAMKAGDRHAAGELREALESYE